ncbi:MAG: MmcQ/YjbR family DNA-binding protein [Flavobacteriales bacterium]|nr:MAG: MmcQ/YjbR family DNA-binding protein [Flavobacteriales bacterium]
MNVEVFRAYCLSKKAVTEGFPFDAFTLVFKVMGKMFALLPLERIPSQVNLKCDPERAVQLREEHDGIIIPGYHMSKTQWNTLFIENLRPKLIMELVDHSYDLVVSNFTKKLKAEFDAMDS